MAGRHAVMRVHSLLQSAQPLVIETTLSGSLARVLRLIERARRYGYLTVGVYVGLYSSELSALRVLERVARGGHSAPMERIHSRYAQSLANLRSCRARFDALLILDNSEFNRKFQAVAMLSDGVLIWRNADQRPWLDAVLKD